MHRTRFRLIPILAAAAGTVSFSAMPVATAGASALLDGSAASAADLEPDEELEAKLAFLMPDIASTRYELFDHPLFEARIAELCPNCEVIYQNAEADPARQQQQADSMITQGVDVIVLDPVDSTAAATIVNNAQNEGIAVIAYDRPIPDIRADFYVSFDNFAIGELIAQSLVDRLDETGAEGGLLQVNGSPTDAAAGLIGDGIHSAIDDSGYELLAEFDTPEWAPSEAQEWVSGQISQFGDQIAGVVAANDGTAGGAIAAFKAAGVDVPPVTGNDAELAAVQRVVAGDQYNTISKPIHIVAEAAAEVAFGILKGETPEPTDELFDTPSMLFTPTVVTEDNVEDVLIGDGKDFTADEVCTGEFADACEELGIA